METANNFNLSVDYTGSGELLEVVFEELTNELLEVEQDHIGEEEARKKETSGEEKEEPPRRFTVKGLAEAFADLSETHKKL